MAYRHETQCSEIYVKHLFKPRDLLLYLRLI